MDLDEPFYFASVLREKLINFGDKIAFPSSCFKRIIVTLKSMSDTWISISL